MNKELELQPCPLEPCPPESGALDFIEWHSKYLRLQAENMRLNKLVRKAYGEGYSFGRDTKIGEINHWWHQSKSKAALQHNEVTE